MGNQDVKQNDSQQELRSLTRQLLADVQALERLLEEGKIESHVRRIGVEQEVFLVDQKFRPALTATEILNTINDPTFTTELGRFNLEMNLDPQDFSGKCLREIEEQLTVRINTLQKAAEQHDTQILLSGILPTLTKEDLTLENMTPNPRYFALNEALNQLRGGKPYWFYIKGVDELNIRHDSVMVEACNTSFQVHFQVSAEQFAHYYNVAQLVTAPVLAAATFSPLLFGKRLWHETRIALFQQAIDTRTDTPHQREFKPRVTFGNQWVDKSVLEIFREDIARFRVLLGTELNEDSLAMVKNGKIPSLKALQLHNGTVYRWNRACYGISNGKPHLRIENRVLPSGPTPADEVANAAFWFGLVSHFAHQYSDVRDMISFSTVKENFLNTAHLGLGAQFTWIDGKTYPAKKLIIQQLLPQAEKGLKEANIDPADISHYLDIIRERVSSEKTGSKWVLKAFSDLRNHGTRTETLRAITAGIINRQKNGQPVHTWSDVDIGEAGDWSQSYLRVEQFMDTDLFTVGEDELIDLVASLMLWNQTRHVMVEDKENRLIGIISHRTILRLVSSDYKDKMDIAVKSIMHRDPVTATPETTTLEAIKIMHEEGISCLPIVEDDKLVGVVNENHFMSIARDFIVKQLRNTE